MSRTRTTKDLKNKVKRPDTEVTPPPEFKPEHVKQDDPEYTIMYDCELRRPGCVLLQVYANIPMPVFHEFFGDSTCWLLAPTKNLRRYKIRHSQLETLAKKTIFERYTP